MTFESNPLDRDRAEVRRMRSDLRFICEERDWVFLPQNHDGLKPGNVGVMIAELLPDP